MSYQLDDFHIRWYADGELNASVNCLDRHLAMRGDKTALIFERDDPTQPAQHVSYRDLHARVCRLANALRAKITIEKGRVVQGNFDDYAPVRMEETPTVEVYAVPSQEAPTGIGEPSVPPVAPALCNAIYSATRKRIRALPILG